MSLIFQMVFNLKTTCFQNIEKIKSKGYKRKRRRQVISICRGCDIMHNTPRHNLHFQQSGGIQNQLTQINSLHTH